ncbi:hypothetical protein Pmar_PMAR014278 [Perkinsus marinus ATCC 50983]|uniref:Uncharacterized protein n=1 Tax=Perkinsus marinus (strain ATCC 50983 / TXsc) TaxID=423536 RepID=C5KNQ7_PERM5|nr:hypothetical protein Pmar_PMAR014278 [Perkinsus marinus ATCC 50983]EER13886.1 hypothetical protein Pmar_PMAR014278 [Perkinsus marinus ATCC 50983]|eukprot:XP_002782091.1 hypothetical protein Pmar_PMAR014278 [Perkinsus marinus ATCC 50983]
MAGQDSQDQLLGGFTEKVSVPEECYGPRGNLRLCADALKEQAILMQVHDQVMHRLQQSGYSGMLPNLELKLLQYATQVVAGVNHDMWVQLLPHEQIVKIRVYQPLSPAEDCQGAREM